MQLLYLRMQHMYFKDNSKRKVIFYVFLKYFRLPTLVKRGYLSKLLIKNFLTISQNHNTFSEKL